jgi:outer membrane protein TolC
MPARFLSRTPPPDCRRGGAAGRIWQTLFVLAVLWRMSPAAAAAGQAEAVPAPAQTAAQALPLTLDEAIGRALAQAPRLAEARARSAAAEATVRAREALARPSLTASSALLRTNHVDEFGVPQAGGGTRIIFPDIPTNYRVRAELAVPVFTAGRVEALVDAAAADSRAAAADTRAAVADVELEAALAYWTLATARERVVVRERALARAEASLEDVGARVDVGLLPPNDRLSAEAQRARQRVQLIQAEQQASLAEADLARLIGEPFDRPIAVTTPLSEPTPGAAALATSAEAFLIERARSARPERLALLERLSSARSAGDAVGRATRPQISALAAVEPARPNPRFVPRTDQWNTAWDVGLNVTWPLWDGGRARAERAAAAAQADAVAARLEDFDARVGVEVRQRLLDLASTQSALEASAQAVAAATEAHRVVGERFAAGVASPTDVLEAEVAMLEAELEQAQLTAALRVGEARLLRTVGTP